MTHGDHLVGADDGFEPGECVGRPVGIEDGQLRLAARIAERQPHQEPVELTLGKAIGALLFDRVLGGGDHERHRKAVADSVGTDLALFHGLEQGRLGLR